MDYKGYNIAVHEFGHNVEQVFSLERIDHTLLSGVPASAFTEALAFIFQARDLRLLGLGTEDATTRAAYALETYWGACEIGAVALVDMDVWHWMYQHPEASPSELRAATVQIAQEVWHRTFGRVMKQQNTALLAVYSHMLAYPLYLSNYPLGHLIEFQLDEHFRAHGDLAGEFERVSRIGNVTPDLWMRTAVGTPLSSEPLAAAALRAVEVLSGQAPSSRKR
jgi:oligoendopeptidase F